MAWKGWEHYTPPGASGGSAKPAKYLNRKTQALDGVLCDSKTEAGRWDQLCLLMKGGVITDLLPHPSFPLFVNGKRTGRIAFDSGYVEQGRLVLEDVKSPRSRLHQGYRTRLRQFQACYPHVTVREWIG